MYKIYIKQAWALIRQERFFSSVYIVGTGLAISMVMALAVVGQRRRLRLAWGAIAAFIINVPMSAIERLLTRLDRRKRLGRFKRALSYS